MIRTIVRAEKQQIKLDIPKEYIGKEIEITYIPLEEVNQERQPLSSKTMKDFWGILSDDTATKLHTHITKTRDEWERNI
ncbi:hypothetical protein [Niabella drilacis]|uniref:Uncharacterized protein n=1 Tax=Niabella drilacis (strain DSM 25811 / CCM 8410 / CCUG 62505 / LMG 26954 / E90) TaxID=1285928 RepID=A0A1G7B3K8_NIADE|nr:hypothetical protein [Niabella drilacis]SDE20815.1 hypothetical protein SAMN04487894_12643 [Niabella drilacis]